MNVVALTGTIKGEPRPFESKGWKGSAKAYSLTVSTRDEVRPGHTIEVPVVISPVVAGPLKGKMADGKPLDGLPCRIEGTLSYGYYMNPQTGTVQFEANVYAKSYEIYDFKEGPDGRLAAQMDAPIDVQKIRYLERKAEAEGEE